MHDAARCNHRAWHRRAILFIARDTRDDNIALADSILARIAYCAISLFLFTALCIFCARSRLRAPAHLSLTRGILIMMPLGDFVARLHGEWQNSVNL